MKKSLLLMGFLAITLAAIAVLIVGNILAQAFLKLAQPLQASIISGVALIVVAVVTVLTNKSIQMKQLTDQSLRSQKVELYNDVFKLYLRILGKNDIVNNPTQKEIQEFFINKTPLFLSYGSNEVVAKWGVLRVTPIDPDDKTYKTLFQLEELMLAIRRDLGHGKSKIKKGDILRLFVNDIDKYI